MSPRNDRGFTYIGLLVMVSLMGVGLAGAGQVWSTASKRDREAELLFIGQEFQRAIGSYYDSTTGANKQYPASFDELLEDKRSLTVRRHLRRIYRDPFTGATSWGFVRGPGGRDRRRVQPRPRDAAQDRQFREALRSIRRRGELRRLEVCLPRAARAGAYARGGAGGAARSADRPAAAGCTRCESAVTAGATRAAAVKADDTRDQGFFLLNGWTRPGVVLRVGRGWVMPRDASAGADGLVEREGAGE